MEPAGAAAAASPAAERQSAVCPSPTQRICDAGLHGLQRVGHGAGCLGTWWHGVGTGRALVLLVPPRPHIANPGHKTGCKKMLL